MTVVMTEKSTTEIPYNIRMIKKYIDYYGKDFVEALIDQMVLTNEKFKTKDLRDLCLKHKVIKPSTKTVRGCFSNHNHNLHVLDIKNGRNETIIRISFNESEIPYIVELFN